MKNIMRILGFDVMAVSIFKAWLFSFPYAAPRRIQEEENAKRN